MVRVEDQTVALDSFDFYLSAMDRRRESRAKSLEQMAARINQEFFDVARKPARRVYQPKVIRSPTPTSSSTGASKAHKVTSLASNPLLASLVRKSTEK